MRGIRGIKRSYRSREVWLAGAAGAALLVAACSGGGGRASGTGQAGARSVPPVISPAGGSSGVSPQAPITVTAASGSRIRSVQVSVDGAPVGGTVTPGARGARATWHSTWALSPAQEIGRAHV